METSTCEKIPCHDALHEARSNTVATCGQLTFALPDYPAHLSIQVAIREDLA